MVVNEISCIPLHARWIQFNYNFPLRILQANERHQKPHNDRSARSTTFSAEDRVWFLKMVLPVRAPRISAEFGKPKNTSDQVFSDAARRSILPKAVTKILTLLSSVVFGGSIRTRTTSSIPTSEKVCLGDNFRRWAADAEDYIEAFPPNERRRALLSLLDGEAMDIARDTRILDEEITAATFVRLRHYLTEEPDIMTVRFQFQSRVQLPGERFSEFVWQLRNLARDAFPDLDLAAQEDKVREQITIGVRHQTLVRKFLKRPQITVQEALDVARDAEQLERLFRDQQVGRPQSISAVQPPPQRRPNWSRPPPRGWVQPYRPNSDF
ncbi:hypothetical protein FGIG_03768 [Fasciola gigantica]|uniref:Paraneoplastic antigen Ma-like C-terminal domain-containing protein n=1 Tax=Fasciola gigantica TaxID=46835 RepID=A0A504Z037_FASGI|nr:hypothetical protein FGIG_03768 [Fasciola gigantica]